jgi:RNA polymerase sigma factor (sigma-70 family)
MNEDNINEYRIKVTVKNNLILRAIENHGYTSIAKFCRDSKLSNMHVGLLISMKNPPLLESGEFSLIAKRLMEELCALPTELWSSEQLTMKLRTNSAHRNVDIDSMRAALGMSATAAMEMIDVDDRLFAEQRKNKVLEMVDTLTPKEKKVLILRFGLDGINEHTLEETGVIFEVTKERIRQIEAKAIRKLRLTGRSEILKDLDNPRSTVEKAWEVMEDKRKDKEYQELREKREIEYANQRHKREMERMSRQPGDTSWVAHLKRTNPKLHARVIELSEKNEYFELDR